MLIHFIRHGQTDDNLRGVIQGQKDTPLNDHGRRQARRLRDALKDVKFAEAHSSSLSRAKETAEIVLEQHPELTLQTHPRLLERGLGSMEGKRWTRGYKLPDDAEPSDALRKRVFKWLEGLLESHFPKPSSTDGTDDHTNHPSASSSPASDNSPDPTDDPRHHPAVLVMSHGAWLGTILRILLQPPFSLPIATGIDLKRQSCHNTSIMKVRFWQAAPSEVREGLGGEEADQTNGQERVGPERDQGAGGKGGRQDAKDVKVDRSKSEEDRDRRKHHVSDSDGSGRSAHFKVKGKILSWGEIDHLTGLMEKDLVVADAAP